MFDHEENLRLMDAARRRAHELRREDAQAYWSAATRFTRDRLRSARRLAAAMVRHAHVRKPPVEA